MTAILSLPTTDAQSPQPSVDDAELLSRFLRDRDESAFSCLIERHGPMVLGVCYRVLRNHHDAEDAFQATFALLARNARSIHHPEQLINWLYGVAHRTALKLRETRQRRKETETKRGLPAPPPIPPLEAAWREVQQALDEEINRLDPKLRAPLVLCYLAGKSHEAAARELGHPTGSMSWLLSRALSELRRRLSSRGVTLTGGMSSLLLALQGAMPVSEELLLNTLRSLGVLGTASPLAALIDLVMRELPQEPARRFPLSLFTLLVLGLGLSAAGYTVVASGWGGPRSETPPASISPGTSEGCKIPDPIPETR